MQEVCNKWCSFCVHEQKAKPTQLRCVLWLSVLTHCSGVASLSAANIASLKTSWEKVIPPEFIQGHRSKAEVEYIVIVYPWIVHNEASYRISQPTQYVSK